MHDEFDFMCVAHAGQIHDNGGALPNHKTLFQSKLEVL